jgi:hypothetical protein
MLVRADAATGTIAMSQPAPAGDRPRELGMVNAPIQGGGITWSAYNWQMIPKDPSSGRSPARPFPTPVWVRLLDRALEIRKEEPADMSCGDGDRDVYDAARHLRLTPNYTRGC